LGFSPRRSNLDNFRRLGSSKVYYLPSGYDETLFASSVQCGDTPAYDVLFVGGADADRASFMTEFMHYGPPIAVAGAYCERYLTFRAYALGTKSPDIIRGLTAAAKVDLCLVRRANRDGHVMHSLKLRRLAVACWRKIPRNIVKFLGRKARRSFISAMPKKRLNARVRYSVIRPNVSALLRAFIVASLMALTTYTFRLATMVGIVKGEGSRIKPRGATTGPMTAC
jgi:hypothetical protein